MWGSIIGAGISALGSLFGDDDDEQVTRTEVDYERMAASAERAGFNPLTAIRNGGSAGFTTTHHPALSSAGGFGEMFQTLGNAIMSFDPRADERAELEQKIQEAQLQSLNLSNEAAARRSFFGDVPSAAGATVSLKPGRGGNGTIPPVTFNPTRNLGPVVSAPFEPVTEYDDAMATIDQVITDVKRVVDKDPFWPYLESITKRKVNSPWKRPPAATKRPRWPATPTPGYNKSALGF